jgi:hypothetical protein
MNRSLALMKYKHQEKRSTTRHRARGSIRYFSWIQRNESEIFSSYVTSDGVRRSERHNAVTLRPHLMGKQLSTSAGAHHSGTAREWERNGERDTERERRRRRAPAQRTSARLLQAQHRSIAQYRARASGVAERPVATISV